jgi:DNA processing protein
MSYPADLVYIIGFSRINGVGSATLQKIGSAFVSWRAAWQSDRSALLACGISPRLAMYISESRSQVDLDHISKQLDQYQDVTIIRLGDPHYPALLAEIHTPPYLLYVRGNIQLLQQASLAIVGTRKPTSYGRHVLAHIIPPLCQAGLCIVSGLALGVDALAHEQALATGGSTLAVLASGVDDITPRTNQQLGEQILAHNGAIVSELPLATDPQAIYFPIRNRIISGLALGTLVVEAGAKSGALITAATALEQNREVYAVPGNILGSQSQGTNKLIQAGAKLTTCADDVLEELNIATTEQHLKARTIIPDNPVEQKIIALLEAEDAHIDTIARKLDRPTDHVGAVLTMMQIKGKIRDAGHGIFTLGQ